MQVHLELGASIDLGSLNLDYINTNHINYINELQDMNWGWVGSSTGNP